MTPASALKRMNEITERANHEERDLTNAETEECDRLVEFIYGGDE